VFVIEVFLNFKLRHWSISLTIYRMVLFLYCTVLSGVMYANGQTISLEVSISH